MASAEAVDVRPAASQSPGRCHHGASPANRIMDDIAHGIRRLVEKLSTSTFAGLVTSAAGLPSLTYSRTIRDDQNQL